MHPAFSVIVFTTASGAGYGLLALLGLTAALGIAPQDRWFGLAGNGLALVLVTAGLLASTAHLSHPERAWRAFSQVRSSWLSREGAAAVLAYLPAGAFALGWLTTGATGGWVAVAGAVAALCSLATVTTTAMIYASLKPIPQWSSRFTLPGYHLYSLASGAVLLNAVAHVFGVAMLWMPLLAAIVLALGWGWKTATWRHNAGLGLPASAGRAIGLDGGDLRSVEWPHTEENYVLKQMGHRVARKHADKLRRFVHLLAFALPLALVLAAALTGGLAATAAAVAAVLCLAPGLFIERWLFFAEARHVVAVYYRPEAAVPVAG